MKKSGKSKTGVYVSDVVKETYKACQDASTKLSAYRERTIVKRDSSLKMARVLQRKIIK